LALTNAFAFNTAKCNISCGWQYHAVVYNIVVSIIAKTFYIIWLTKTNALAFSTAVVIIAQKFYIYELQLLAFITSVLNTSKNYNIWLALACSGLLYCSFAKLLPKQIYSGRPNSSVLKPNQ